MTGNKFTLIDGFNQFWILVENTGIHSLRNAGFTYFYLLKIWNATGRPNSFKRQNKLVCAELGISRPTLDRHRDTLRQLGLLQFTSSGNGDPNICYQIPVRSDQEIARENDNNFTSPDVTQEVKMENFVATDVTSPLTSGDVYKQSKSKEKEILVVVVSDEKKRFNFFEKFFLTDAGLQAACLKLGLHRDFFLDALEQWMIRNHGKVYPDLPAARKHFLFWLPYYKIQKEKYHESSSIFTQQENSNSGRKTDLDYAEGL